MKKILIVDDMVVSLMMTENMLCGHYITFCASSGQEAIEIYRREHPDMVLSDLRMPGMNGYELQRALQQEMQQTIPFMFMTADSDEDTESKGFENGAMDFLRKPFRPDVLLRRVSNILQTVDQIESLKRHASIDSLTGLLNKSSAEEELKRVCAQASGALLMIDLDSFKPVNDIYGHSMGDKVLMSFADILRASVRPDDVLGRLGGDEFVAFCNGMHDEQGIANKAASINTRVMESAKELMGADMSIPIGASIGCVFVPSGGTEYAELVQKADKALYAVKQNGKHGYAIFSEKRLSRANEGATLTDVEKILGERSPGRGALRLPFEEFRAVYRFLKRTMGIFNKSVSILRFSLPKGKAAGVEDEFLSLLCSTLRAGDVVTETGGQFLVLLVNTSYPNLSHAVDRFRQNWVGTNAGADVEFEYEWSVMEP
ncbi:MAG: diguanylate cyclase [Schwartzia sp.]|nr:diguanylate cyclase [Schwartzia sp. (in: firmicutes)]